MQVEFLGQHYIDSNNRCKEHTQLGTENLHSWLQRLPPPVRIVGIGLTLLWEEWLLLIVMNLIWLVATLTIVAGPPVWVALYAVAQRTVQGRKPALRDLWQSSRRYWWQSWLWALVNLLLLAILSFAYLFYAEIAHGWGSILQMVVATVLVLWLLAQLYTVPVLVVQSEPSLRQAWLTAWQLTWRYPGITVALALSTLTLGGVTILTQGMFFVLAGPALLALIACQGLALIMHLRSQ